MRKTIVVLTALAAMLVAYAGSALAQATPPAAYTVTDLGPAGSWFSVNDINDTGQMAGKEVFDDQVHAALYEDGVWKDLGTPGSDFSSANALSNTGLVVGRATFDGQVRAFLYENGAMKNLGTTPDSLYSRAYGVNDAGQVVGGVMYSSGERAFLYENGAMKDLGTLSGSGQSEAMDVNGSGQVVGYSDSRAFLYEGGTMKSLGTLPGGTFSRASAVNDPGQVVGHSNTLLDTGEYVTRPFLYENGTMKDLGTLPGSTMSEAKDINDSGQVVGTSRVSRDSSVGGFLYSDGQMKDLNDLIPADSGWRIYSAAAINNNGQILGTGVLDGDARYVLLNPTPPDTTAPTVTGTKPANKATGVRRAAPLTATFSEVMDRDTVDGSTFKLYKVASTGTKQVKNVTVGLSPEDGLTATLDPFGTSTTVLAKNTKYKAVVTTGAMDPSGNALDQSAAKAGGQQKAWTFTTGKR